MVILVDCEYRVAVNNLAIGFPPASPQAGDFYMLSIGLGNPGLDRFPCPPVGREDRLCRDDAIPGQAPNCLKAFQWALRARSNTSGTRTPAKGVKTFDVMFVSRSVDCRIPATRSALAV